MKASKVVFLIGFAAVLGLFLTTGSSAQEKSKYSLKLPKIREDAVLTFAPEVPPPIVRKKPAVVVVNLVSGVKEMEIKTGETYKYWTFNDHVPGPFIRTRVGDTLEIHHTNTDVSGMPHNVDFHAVLGPGGGAPVTTVVKGDERVAWFKLTTPGLFIYHCAAPPVMDHIANGMYGLILVEPEKGLPKVDKEFYVLQSEFYTDSRPHSNAVGHEHMEEKKAEGDVWGEEMADKAGPKLLQFVHQEGLDEHPTFVVFNGQYGKHTGEGKLKTNVGDKVRIFFGNGGPNLVSSFHVIGTIFENVYREGDLISSPAHGVQTTLVPPGGSAVVDFGMPVPGTFTMVDHAIFRVEKGAVGFIEATGDPNYDIYASDQEAQLCPGCLVHP